ncbi:hypothetical protein F5878DRAFT_619962 [Lentinula raphanica]|uniref:Secreted protein n=1 Tax=Lentinula raphanica TaxID=153919 RepID=A0AA38UHC5_9AGAR|nr:hypothetical protein F5878DRAFT_619962 [Lentinula raphanica]
MRMEGGHHRALAVRVLLCARLAAYKSGINLCALYEPIRCGPTSIMIPRIMRSSRHLPTGVWTGLSECNYERMQCTKCS